MLDTNPSILSWLTSKRDSARDSLDSQIADLVKHRAQQPGLVSDRLSWNTRSMMYNDQAFAHYQKLLDMTSGEDDEGNPIKATWESLETYYTDRIMRWYVPQSTSQVSNVEEQVRLEVMKDVLETIQGIKGTLARKGE